MKARLLAVQRTLLSLLVASLVLSVLALPRGRNRDYMTALEELKAFQSAFQQKLFEKELLDYAQKQGLLRASDVAAQVKGPGVPKVQATKGATDVLPRAVLTLDTLGEVDARASGATTLPIGVLDVAQLGASIAWRLSRVSPVPEGPVQLGSVTLGPDGASEADVKREREIPTLRQLSLDADKAFAKAEKRLQAAEDLYTARRKWKASWKMMLKADEGRKEARAALDEATADRDRKRADYERAAKLAEAWKGAKADDAVRAAATVSVVVGGQSLSLVIPVALETREAALPQLKGIGLAATRTAGLWDEVQGKSVEQAIDAVRSHFTWHYRYVELFGLKLGGMTLLHVLPVLLPAVLFLLLVQIRRVSVSYNPFGTVEALSLPRVGLGPRVVDAAVLAILPFVAAILATISLIAIAEIPVLPLLSGFLSLGLGAYVFIELGSLQSLIEAVSRSHSTPPPPKS